MASLFLTAWDASEIKNIKAMKNINQNDDHVEILILSSFRMPRGSRINFKFHANWRMFWHLMNCDFLVIVLSFDKERLAKKKISLRGFLFWQTTGFEFTYFIVFNQYKELFFSNAKLRILHLILKPCFVLFLI